MVHLKELPHKVLQGISRLAVYYCELDCSAHILLSSLVPIMTSLNELDISGNPAGDGETVNLLKALTDMDQLHSLRMDYIAIGCDDVMALSSLIQPSAGNLKEIWIGDEMPHEAVDMMVEKVLPQHLFT